MYFYEFSLELPVELIHSTIGRLVMKVPWNKLSSAPVEVLIEDILIVIAPRDPKVSSMHIIIRIGTSLMVGWFRRS